MKHKIAIIDHKKQFIQYFSPQSYAYYSDGTFPLLQKFLFKILHKLGAFQRLREEIVKTVEIDEDDIVKLIKVQYFSLVEAGKTPKHIYLGYKQLDSVSFSGVCDFYISFDVNGGLIINEIPVTVLPNLDGVLVVP